MEQAESGFTLTGVLTAVAIGGVLMAALISFTNQSAQTLKYQNRMASFNSKSITLFQNINKLCENGNFMSASPNTTASAGFPIKLKDYTQIKLGKRVVLKKFKGREYDIDKISLHQDGPVMGTAPRVVSTHLLIEGTIKKSSYIMVSGKRKYDRKPITRRFPLLMTLGAGGNMVGCVIPTVTKEQMCAGKGGVWQGAYASPRCLI